MNNNTNNSDGDIPEKVLELIPWYAIGKLSVDDQAFFEKALVSYPSLQRQLDLEQQMIEKVSADKSLLDKSVIANSDERLKSVFNIIDIAESQNQQKLDNQSSLLGKLKNVFDMLIPSPDSVPQYARVASVAVLVLSVAVLTAFVAPLFTDKSDFIPASTVTQSNENQSSLIKSAKTTLLVGFNGTSVELGNNDILKGKLLKVESVPDKEGMFQISFKQTMNADEIKQTLDALLLQKELIWFAGEAF